MAHNFKDVPTVFADNDPAGLEAGTEMFAHLGFRNVGPAATLDALQDRLAEGEVALLIGNTAMAEGEFLHLVGGIRNNQVGGQPFVPVIALVADPDPAAGERIAPRGLAPPLRR